MPGPDLTDPRTPSLLQHAERKGDALVRFLRDLVRLRSYSGQEEAVVHRVEMEMRAVGFDEVRIDPLGNILGRVGAGERVLACDAHLDTVAVTDPGHWHVDPFGGEVIDGALYGRGAVDQKAGMAAMVYAGKLIKELGLAAGCQVWMVGSVMEEDCDGLCWHYILQEKILAPELVISTEPTGLKVNRGQRGRMEIRVATRGRSCHGAMPHLGENAIYKLAPAVPALAQLNGHLAEDPFLGKGTCAVTWIGSEGPSLCAVPDRAELHLDRRLTAGETRDRALAEVREALQASGVEAEVRTLVYEQPSWRGLVYPLEKYFPTWVLPADHPAVLAASRTWHDLLGREAEIGRWIFSTNGVAINGLHRVPCIGFGPGREELAHGPDEHVPVRDLIQACAFYAAFPDHYLRGES